MRILSIALLLFCMIGLSSAAAEVVSRIAAVVNKDIITTNQLDQKLQEQLAKQERQPSPAQLGALRQEMLSRMIEETLVEQRIKALNLRVSEDEIETALLDVQKKNQLSREALQEAVMVQGLDFDAYRENLRQQILRYKLIGEEVRSQVEVSEREVVEYYRAHLDDYRLAPEIQLSAITFPISKKASDQERQQIRKIAGEALARLRQGQELAQVVASYNATYGATGGELGRFTYGELVPGFVDAINGIEEGHFSEPVDAAEAIHLLRVDKRFAGGLRQFDAVNAEIYQMILDQKTDARIKEWTRSLKARSFIDIRL
ncbi:MAG: SurA N-terminal domain-containing protein [Desulfuromonadales bacterium]|nr:SurA N-terminal domain-containing protein [Desulfuromonadales bacterium]